MGFSTCDVSTEVRSKIARWDLEPGLGHLLEVRSCAERPVAGAREHQHARLVVRVELVDRGEQTCPHGAVECIPRFGTVDRHPGDAVDDLVVHDVRRHDPASGPAMTNNTVVGST